MLRGLSTVNQLCDHLVEGDLWGRPLLQASLLVEFHNHFFFFLLLDQDLNQTSQVIFVTMNFLRFSFYNATYGAFLVNLVRYRTNFREFFISPRTISYHSFLCLKCFLWGSDFSWKSLLSALSEWKNYLKSLMQGFKKYLQGWVCFSCV